MVHAKSGSHLTFAWSSFGRRGFHIGATFNGVDFNQPDPIIIQNVTLFDGSGNPLTLHPRLPIYDTGAVDTADSTFRIHFDAPVGAAMRLVNARIYLLPRVASLESMTGEGRPSANDGLPIRPWSETKCEATSLRASASCLVAKLSDAPHVEVTHRLGEKGVIDCGRGGIAIKRSEFGRSDDRPKPLDYEGPICAGTQRDLFPATTVYLVATFEEANVRHDDAVQRAYLVGPVTSKLFYQFAGIKELAASTATECHRACPERPAKKYGEREKVPAKP